MTKEGTDASEVGLRLPSAPAHANPGTVLHGGVVASLAMMAGPLRETQMAAQWVRVMADLHVVEPRTLWNDCLNPTFP